MVSDEEIYEWAKRKYPEYANNLKLMRMLYEKEHGRGRRESREIEYKKIKVSDLDKTKDGDFVELELLVADFARTLRYEGCPKCRRKNCSCGLGKITYRRDSYWAGDDTGIVKIFLPWEKEEGYDYLEIGSKIVVRGRVDEFNGKKMIDVKEYFEASEDDKTDQIEQIVNELRPTKRMMLDVFESYVSRRYGLTVDDFKDYIKIESDRDGKWVVF